jgi:two-component system, LuxR family, response regulator FixJ
VLQRVQEALHLDREQRRRSERQQSLNDRLNALTPRERDVLPLLTEGLSSKHIARELGLSPRTVETHRANLLRKMQVDSVTALTKLLLTLPQQ